MSRSPIYPARLVIYADPEAEGTPVFTSAPFSVRLADDAKTPSDKPIVILYSDDSTLFFALRMRAQIAQTRNAPPVELVWYMDENALSTRQMAQLLPEGPAYAVNSKELSALAATARIRAIVTCRVFRPLAVALQSEAFRARSGRPCVIACLGGLDFFPQDGFERRRNCDGVYLFPVSNIAAYEKAGFAPETGWQEVGFGHPSFLRPSGPPADLAQRRDIYFFTQALSPSTRRGRLHMIKAMAAIARANPDHTVWIKLRHLPTENRKHLHQERYDYPSLMKTLDLPANLKMTACTMDEALDTAALGITCTSTAAIDVVRAGVPAMVHLDFVDHYRDPLVAPMRNLFAASNLITSLEDMLNLRAKSPDPRWIENMLCPDDLGERMMDTIAKFEARPFQVPGPPA